ncbi:MAG TPA: leucyl/phenylalanyl-tRNA--protein transferase [Actinopolymorphaceae bacterium]
MRDHDYVGEGADFEPGTLLAAYRKGIFPMPLRPGGPPTWWSPVRRGILPLETLRVSRSLRQSCRRFEIRIDTAVEEVIRACADPSRPGGWISDEIIAAYLRLHDLGWVHSVEAWTPDGRLAGGLYGVAIGGLFAGESMFHRVRDASKVALVALVDILRKDGDPDGRLLDVQWQTPHLASLGAIEVARADYLRLLRHALTLPNPPAFGDASWRAETAPDQGTLAPDRESGQDGRHA